MVSIKIKPITKKLDTLDIVNVSIQLDNSANIGASVRNETGMGEFYSLTMDAETYAGWGDDDTYVVNWVMKELGLSYPTK